MNPEILCETERLILRQFRETDLPDLFEYLSDEEVLQFEPYKPINIAEMTEELRSRIASDEMIAVELKSTGKLIGNIYLGKRDFYALEIGYVFNKRFWGQGFAKESCAAVIKKAFSMGIHRVFAECDPQNIRSWKLLESLGLEREAHLKQNVYFWTDEHGNPLWKDTYIYAVLNTEKNCTHE